ncbi:MAG TPA: type VI secretion system baseplate subunit TssE [Crenalkalicoccus sp.]|jgi:type VI secretion system protein ImpF|nr:type VI secretion system baseplate subunit TssE [Crenalkalicoccus sp.]
MGDTLNRKLRVRLPLFDCLLDADPDAPPDPPLTAQLALERLRRAVRRDVEAVLNARRRRLPTPPHLTELAVSPVGYGVPDPTAGSFTEEDLRIALAREMEVALRRFEPRLFNVQVTLAPLPRGTDATTDRTMHLRIDAFLRTDQVPEPITFDTALRPITLDVAVRED